MSDIHVESHAGVATVALERGKVNAINTALVEELTATFAALQRDDNICAVVLTGRGKFFSFGFDIPEFLAYSKEQFTAFLVEFASLYRDLFIFPKPLIAALNGHAVAGGCMLALTADRAIMPDGPVKISLNEIGFGSSVFAGSVEILQFHTGARASEVLYSGAMYSPAEAKEIGLVAEVAPPESLLDRAREMAAGLGVRRPGPRSRA